MKKNFFFLLLLFTCLSPWCSTGACREVVVAIEVRVVVAVAVAVEVEVVDRGRVVRGRSFAAQNEKK